VETFTCQTGVQVKDVAMGSVDAGRQVTAGGQKADLYAPADYLDIDLLMKPAGYADFNIVFARGKMVLAYSQKSVAEKKLPSIVAPGSRKHRTGGTRSLR
jgi:ABC-type molybdate transport system substrate-binding protein